MEPENGLRKRIAVPKVGDGYLISMPFADKDYFQYKIPFENRAEYNKWRKAIDSILDVVNEYVEAIHEHYNEMLEEDARIMAHLSKKQ